MRGRDLAVGVGVGAGHAGGSPEKRRGSSAMAVGERSRLVVEVAVGSGWDSEPQSPWKLGWLGWEEGEGFFGATAVDNFGGGSVG